MWRLLRTTWRLAAGAMAIYSAYRALDALLAGIQQGAEKGQRVASSAQGALDTADQKLAQAEKKLEAV